MTVYVLMADDGDGSDLFGLYDTPEAAKTAAELCGDMLRRLGPDGWAEDNDMGWFPGRLVSGDWEILPMRVQSERLVIENARAAAIKAAALASQRRISMWLK